MGFFDSKFIKVAIVIYDGDGNVVNRAKPNAEDMRTAHKVGRKLAKETNHGEDYEVIQL